jgi:hypothetical protein
MEYMVLIYRDEAFAPEYGSPEWEQMMAGFLAFNQRLIDGPYAETKEQLGGFYLVRADTLDEVLDLARSLPIEGAIEVRPLTYRPTGE